MPFQTTSPAAKKPSLRRRLKAKLMVGTCLLALVGQPAAARSVWGDIGAAAGTAWEQTKTAVHQGSVDAGNFLQKGVDGVNHFANQVAKGFCDVMTLGRSSKGKAGCSVNGGVGAQTDRRGNTTYYTYNPQDPGTHYPVMPDQTTMPRAADLAQLDRIFGTPVPLQDWEKHQADLLGDLLKPGDKIGLPWVGMLNEVHSPAKEWNVRPGGAFLDYRTDLRYPDGRRWHGGLDVLNKVGDDVYAVAGGTITRQSSPGRPGMMGVEIVTPSGYTISTYYVEPTPEIKAALAAHQIITVTPGQKIGTAQDLHPAYPDNIVQHVHVTVKDAQGRFVDPQGKVYLVMKHGEPNRQVPVEAQK